MLIELFALKQEEQKQEDLQSAILLDSEYGFVFQGRIYIPNFLNTQIVPNSTIWNLNHTISSFENFIKNWKWYCSAQKIPKSSQFHISKYKLNQGFFSAQTIYKLHLFETLITQHQKSVFTFADFLDLFFNLATKKDRIVSFSRFIQSNVVSIFSTGLAFSIFEENNINSKDKYINDSYFSVFRDLCLHNNFLIDNRLPWVIVHRATDNEPLLRPESYISVYKEEINILIDTLKLLWLEYVNSLSNDEKVKIKNNDFTFDGNKLVAHFVKAKCRERNVKLSSVANIIRWFMLNSIRNGIEDSNYKLSVIKMSEYERSPLY